MWKMLSPSSKATTVTTYVRDVRVPNYTTRGKACSVIQLHFTSHSLLTRRVQHALCRNSAGSSNAIRLWLKAMMFLCCHAKTIRKRRCTTNYFVETIFDKPVELTLGLLPMCSTEVLTALNGERPSLPHNLDSLLDPPRKESRNDESESIVKQMRPLHTESNIFKEVFFDQRFHHFLSLHHGAMSCNVNSFSVEFTLILFSIDCFQIFQRPEILSVTNIASRCPALANIVDTSWLHQLSESADQICLLQSLQSTIRVIDGFTK